MTLHQEVHNIVEQLTKNYKFEEVDQMFWAGYQKALMDVLIESLPINNVKNETTENKPNSELRTDDPQDDERKEFLQAYSRLKQHEQYVFDLREIYNLNFREIGEKINKSQARARQIYIKAKEKLNVNQ